MISIVFAVGYENQVSVLDFPDRTPSNNADIVALYKEIEAGCPSIRNHNLIKGVFKADFSRKSDKIENICRLTFRAKGMVAA